MFGRRQLACKDSQCQCTVGATVVGLLASGKVLCRIRAVEEGCRVLKYI